MHRLFLLLQFFDRLLDPFRGEGVKLLFQKPAIVTDFLLQILAFVAHRLTAFVDPAGSCGTFSHPWMPNGSMMSPTLSYTSGSRHYFFGSF